MAKRIELNKTSPSKHKKTAFGSKPKAPQSVWQRLKRLLFKIFLGAWLASVLMIVLYKFLPVYLTPTMLDRKITAWTEGKSGKIYSHWTPYEEMDSNAALAVLAAEDQRFPAHFGVDTEALFGAVKNNMKGKRIKGASTISQQVAKNVFLWQHRDYFRKALELYFTWMIELIWGKERILEVYLNVAETGPMTFGVEAASRRYYGHSASELSRSEAARIAAVLPNPKRFSIANPSPYIQRRTQRIQNQMRQLGGKTYLENLK